MTFPRKEDLIAVENIAKFQHTIFNDSIDIGVHVSEIADYENFKKHVKNLIDFYGYVRKEYGNQVVADIAIPTEKYGNGFDCQIVHLAYVKIDKPHPSQIKKYYNKNNSFIHIGFATRTLSAKELKNYWNSKIFDEE